MRVVELEEVVRPNREVAWNAGLGSREKRERVGECESNMTDHEMPRYSLSNSSFRAAWQRPQKTARFEDMSCECDHSQASQLVVETNSL